MLVCFVYCQFICNPEFSNDNVYQISLWNEHILTGMILARLSS